ncbi:MAG: AMP-binding protein [Verrucomicrobiae bacterium]
MKAIAPNPMQAAAFLRDESSAKKLATQVSISFGEKMDRAALRTAWDRVCSAREVLRSSFARLPDGKVRMIVTDSGSTVWRELDWQALAPEEIPCRWAEIQASDASEPFDPQALVRLTEILLPGGGAHYLLAVPSFLLDEPSVARLLLDWLIALDRPLSIVEAADPASPAPWSLEPGNEPLVLHPRPPGLAYASAAMKIGREESARFIAACHPWDPGVVIESLWALTLRRLGASGNVSLRRFDARQSPQDVGYFESWLPIAHSWNSTSWLSDACARHEAAKASAGIAEPLSLAPDDPAASSFQTGFVWGGHDLNDTIHTALPRWINFDARMTRGRPDLLLLEARPGIALEIHGPLGSEPAARELLGRLADLIESFESVKAKPPVQIPVLLPNEARLFREWSRGQDPSDHPDNTLQAFREIAERFPAAVAVQDGDEELTYLELDSLSDRLAAHLAKASMAGGWHVALFLSPSSWIAIALIGSWKAGNSCFALDPSAPPEWIESMLASHDAGLVLCDTASAPLLDTSTRRRIILDQEWDALELAELPAPACKPGSPAAVIPGHPDGLAPIFRALTHEMLAAAAIGGARALDFHQGDSFLAHSPAGGGAFFDEWLIPLLSGGTVKVANDDFLDLVHARATHVRMTAPEWNNQAARWMRTGEAFESPLRIAAVEMGTASKLSLDVWNRTTGGQVKTVTFFSLAGLCGLGIAGPATPDGPLLAVGKPVAETEAAVTDADSHDLPPGFSGHLWMKFPGWKSLAGSRGRRGIETGLHAWRTRDGDIRLEGSAASGLACPSRAADLLSRENVLDAFEGEHLWALAPCEGAIAVSEWPLTRGGWIDESLLPKPQRAPQAHDQRPPAAAPATSSTPWVPVSVLQPEGTSSLVLVPPASGVPDTYRDLIAAIGTTRRLLGLTARGAAHSPHTTIEGAAAEWIQALLAEDPSLPFHLCGFGYGAIAALEMARQLATAKRPVPGLILIGAPAPQTEDAPGWLASMKNVFKRLQAPGRIEPFAAMDEPARTHESAWNRYRFVPCDIPAKIILPSDFCPDAGSAWLDILPSADVEQVKCTWSEMLAFPAVKRLATIIAQ